MLRDSVIHCIFVQSLKKINFGAYQNKLWCKNRQIQIAHENGSWFRLNSWNFSHTPVKLIENLRRRECSVLQAKHFCRCMVKSQWHCAHDVLVHWLSHYSWIQKSANSFSNVYKKAQAITLPDMMAGRCYRCHIQNIGTITRWNCQEHKENTQHWKHS